MMLLRILLLLLSLLSVAGAPAGVLGSERFRRLVHWFDVADTVGCDTSYVRLADEGFIAYVNLVRTGTKVHVSRPEADGSLLHDRLSTAPTESLGLGVSYRGWGLNYTHQLSSTWNDDAFNLSFSSRRYGLDYRYHSANSLSPEGISPNEHSGRLHTTSFTGYWVFQRSRFSHPGAMLHTTFQQRSAGSWLGAVNYWYGSYRGVDMGLPDAFGKLSLSHLNVGGGYAYTLVFGRRHCALTGILLPMVNVWHRNRLYDLSGGSEALSQQFSADVVCRLCFVYNFRRFLTGIQYFADNSYSPRFDRVTIHTHDWSSRVFVGFRF